MVSQELYYILVKRPEETEYRKIGVATRQQKEKIKAKWQKQGYDVRTALVEGDPEIPWQMMRVKSPRPGERIAADITPYEKARALQRKQLDSLQKLMEYARLHYTYYQFERQFKDLAEMIIDDSGIRAQRDAMLEKLRQQIYL